MDSGGGYYRLRSRHSGKVLDDYQWSTAENAQIVQWADLNGTNQQFRLVSSDSGYVRLINRHSNKALSVQGASTANGTNIVQTTDTNSAYQQWQLVRLGGTTPPPGGTLPTTIRWSSSGVLAGPKPDSAHPDIAAIKDYTVVGTTAPGRCTRPPRVPRRAGTWCISRSRIGRRRTRATHTYLDATPIGRGYRAAPHIFFFAPQGLWYMVYQTGLPTYSTSTDPGQSTLVDDAAELHEQRAGDRDAEQGCRLMARLLDDLRQQQLLPVLQRRQRAHLPFADDAGELPERLRQYGDRVAGLALRAVRRQRGLQGRRASINTCCCRKRSARMAGAGTVRSRRTR